MGDIDKSKYENTSSLEQQMNLRNRNSKETTTTTTTQYTPIQIGLGLIIVGASAGLTLYTKRTASLLSQLERNKAPKFLSKNLPIKKVDNNA